MAVEIRELSGAWNFRDVATTTGVRPGRLFRSSELSRLSEEGRRRLVELGISDVADLRSDREVDRLGAGQVPETVSVHRLPFRELGEQAPHEQAFEQALRSSTGNEDVAIVAARYMTDEYAKYPGLAGAQSAVRRVISLLADGQPVLAHCFAGKDRTGFTVAVTLEAAGVSRDAVMDDYLRSNQAVPQLRERILESLHQRGVENTQEIETFAEARLTEEVLGVRDVYLHAALKEIDEGYGSVRSYLEAIGVTTEQVSRLRSTLH
ncbi:tyrosine-protein phosphatase [Mycolicibacterium elephantis]|uniref:Phosphotyrosine protein phosphatase n=1 Tax=Mycolicibacterium elephantis TaxID=81858 RepID=A0A1X0D451_9MYCO|nr:tyrosine-protein phosphatase [Mycolicibacterium elephantis]ORA67184.1 phosphotyrosine protein phosphatase [Mycolicibacterium elephantis]